MDRLPKARITVTKEHTLHDFGTVRFWVVQLLWLAALTLFVIFWQPYWANQGIAMTLYQVLVPVVGALAGLAILFLIHWFLAPHRVRNEWEIYLAERLMSISVADPRDCMMILRWLQGSFEINMTVSRAVYRVDAFDIKLLLQNEPAWPHIQKHLRKGQLLKHLDNWGRLVAKDLNMRKRLLEAISEKVRVNFHLPIRLDNINVDKDARPYLTKYYVANLYDQIFSKMAGIGNRPLEASDFEIDESKGAVYFPNRGSPLVCSNDSEQRKQVIDLLLGSSTSLMGLLEAESAKEAYSKAKDETNRLKGELKDIMEKIHG